MNANEKIKEKPPFNKVIEAKIALSNEYKMIMIDDEDSDCYLMKSYCGDISNNGFWLQPVRTHKSHIKAWRLPSNN